MTWAVAATVVVLAVVSFGLGWVVTWLGVAIALRGLRRSEGAPWYERARRAYPARRQVAVNAVLVPLAIVELVLLGGVPGLGSGTDTVPWAALGGLAGLSGVMMGGGRLERRLCRAGDGPPAAGVHLWWLLGLPVYYVYGLVLALMPVRWGWPAAAVLGLGAALTTFHIAGGLPVVLRRFGLARPASERLAAVVARAADRGGVRPRAVLELVSPSSNALAFPVPGLLVYTVPLLATLDDDELGAVTAHELGHLAEPRGVLTARVAASYLVVFTAAGIPLGGSFGLWAGVAPVALLLAGMLVMRRVGRRMEERADRLGRDHEGVSEGVYARALEKLYEANLMPAVMIGRRHIHPHLYDRMIASGVTPAYARPAPPARDRLSALPALVLVAGVVVAIAAVHAGRGKPGSAAAHALARRAEASYRAGDLEASARLYRGAAAIDPSVPHYPAGLAVVLLRLGRFEDAEAAALRAEAALARRPYGAEGVGDSIAQVRDWVRRLRGAARRDGSPPG